MDKQQWRQRIAVDTEAFLDAGGVIEQLPRKQVCPKSMRWARRRGYDYTPWERVGGSETTKNCTQLDEGCYMTKALDTGD